VLTLTPPPDYPGFRKKIKDSLGDLEHYCRPGGAGLMASLISRRPEEQELGGYHPPLEKGGRGDLYNFLKSP
jgi:hypothetical protein